MKTPFIRSILAVFALGLPSAFAQTTQRASVDSVGVQGNNGSYYPSISSDGRFVAFDSSASSLVWGDTNNAYDIFVHDRQTGQTTRVSVDSLGVQGNSDSFLPSISSDGRFVTFNSPASNLVPGDTNGYWDVFVHDRQAGQTTRVSVDSGGLQGNLHSYSWRPSISSDGRFVAFSSEASNLVPGDTNDDGDIFVHDRQTGQTTRVSVDSGGVQGNRSSDPPSISSDGRFVAFSSNASNLVPGDTNNRHDAFVHNLQTDQTTLVSVDSGGVQGSDHSYFPSISSDGRFVAFESNASNLVPGDTNAWPDIFFHDQQTGQTTRVNVDSGGLQGNSTSERASISSEGRFVAFFSFASNLVPGDTNGASDIFVHDRLGLSLALTGSCSGAVTLTISNATANGSVAIVFGQAGVFVKPTPPCQGLTLGVAPPTLAAIRTADGGGTATLNFTAPPGACGRSVQAVDVMTCTATNVIVL
jgi:archaellum component FlaF (FlaF/FlaG flagellin family)